MDHYLHLTLTWRLVHYWRRSEEFVLMLLLFSWISPVVYTTSTKAHFLICTHDHYLEPKNSRTLGYPPKYLALCMTYNQREKKNDSWERDDDGIGGRRRTHSFYLWFLSFFFSSNSLPVCFSSLIVYPLLFLYVFLSSFFSASSHSSPPYLSLPFAGIRFITLITIAIIYFLSDRLISNMINI